MQIEHVIGPGAEWNEFAEAHSEARLGHAAAWAAIFKSAYRLDSHYLCARNAGGSIQGILPLVLFKSRPTGRKRLVSLPYLDGAGILAPDGEIVAARARVRVETAERALDLTHGGARVPSGFSRRRSQENGEALASLPVESISSR